MIWFRMAKTMSYRSEMKTQGWAKVGENSVLKCIASRLQECANHEGQQIEHV